ncbi:transposase [Paraburkholderia sp. Se-20369]|nr:transposase [Paraburkholderia sp. Se-20369]
MDALKREEAGLGVWDLCRELDISTATLYKWRSKYGCERCTSRKTIKAEILAEAFGISQICYRYVSVRDAESDEIANWLPRLTDNHQNWGFGLRFLYLRNVKGLRCNHRRVYRIYRERESNLRIKPRKRLVRLACTRFSMPSRPCRVRSNHATLVDERCDMRIQSWSGETILKSTSLVQTRQAGIWRASKERGTATGY